MNKRPTSLELLQSEYLPPLQSGEAQLQETFSRTISNPQCKAYKYLISSCFHQKLSAVENITYDMDIPKMLPNSLIFTENVKSIIKSVFERHGGIELSLPLLLPKSKLYDTVDSCVNVMTHSGSIVSLPHDLRVPFARYVSRHGISFMKRFSIDRVFRERKVYGFHPRELTECAFDIIEPTQGQLSLVMPIAHLLLV